ncbi:hypothetical protein HHI36_005565 [Cryptolaemus montrouzieri]|uniref:HORMA domain-containing protein n=1 Tax=Cryptolaemus montrouzieri TaxID=559131 RepID=A0ABD2NW58_9CUCU
MAPTKIDLADTLGEFLEVAVHNILYSRKLYPDAIFVPKRKYGVVVHQSIHPDVNSYVSECLKATNYHLKKSQLKQFCVIIQNGEHIFEKFVFDVMKVFNNIESDPYLLELEKNLRNFCLKLHSSKAYVDSLPSDSTFTISICTTELSSLEFNDNPVFEDFPWIHCSSKDYCLESPDIIPLQTVDLNYLDMQIYIETPCVEY